MEEEINQADATKVDDQWQALARQHWLGRTEKGKRPNDILIKRDIWDVLEQSHFAYHSLLSLESLQLLEKHVYIFRIGGRNRH